MSQSNSNLNKVAKLSPAQQKVLDWSVPLSAVSDHGLLVSGHAYRTAESLERMGMGTLRYQGPSLGWFTARAQS